MTNFDCNILIFLNLVVRKEFKTVALRVYPRTTSQVCLCSFKIFCNRCRYIWEPILNRQGLRDGECNFLVSYEQAKFRCVILVQHGLLIHRHCVSKLDLMTFLMSIVDEESAELDKLGIWSLSVDRGLSILVLNKKSIERTLPGLILLRRLSRTCFHYN